MIIVYFSQLLIESRCQDRRSLPLGSSTISYHRTRPRYALITRLFDGRKGISQISCLPKHSGVRRCARAGSRGCAAFNVSQQERADQRYQEEEEPGLAQVGQTARITSPFGRVDALIVHLNPFRR